MARIITLTTDFGPSQYAGIMKGVILSQCPDARIVDITHNIEHFNIRHCMWVLSSSVPYFPQGSIHIAVVDPGVGTERRPIIVKKDGSFFIGPDNGIFSFIENPDEIHTIDIPAKSHTFHGRDVFAVAGAKIAQGIPPSEIGKKADSFVRLEMYEVTVNRHKIRGKAEYIDSFGNVITNISKGHLEKANIKYGDKIKIESGKNKFQCRFWRTYGESRPGELSALMGSSGYLEIAVNLGSSHEKTKISPGDYFEVILCEEC